MVWELPIPLLQQRRAVLILVVVGYGVGALQPITKYNEFISLNPCCGGKGLKEVRSVLFGALAGPHCRNVHWTFLHPCCDGISFYSTGHCPL